MIEMSDLFLQKEQGVFELQHHPCLVKSLNLSHVWSWVPLNWLLLVCVTVPLSNPERDREPRIEKFVVKTTEGKIKVTRKKCDKICEKEITIIMWFED